ncbi:MAG: cation:proton antiporter [Thermoanaerobaculia bacterium]
MEPHSGPGILLAFAAALLGAKVLGELAERIGQPSVLGELLAGVILGPSLLGWVPVSEALLVLAQIGVILLLFEVGLETDLGELVRVGVPALNVALAGMVMPFAGGFFLTRALGHPVVTSVFVGAALTATSIGITARVLSELGVLDTREGRIILGAAVVDDVLGLVVLAVVSQMGTGGGAAGTIMRATVLAIGFLLLAVAAGIPIGRRLIRIVGRANVRGVLLAAAVGLALLMSVAAKRAGSAEIVGAFATGLVLARTNRRHDIDRAVKPVVDVFAPLFFVAVGAQVDVAFLDPRPAGNRSALLLAAGLTAVGFAGKFAAGFFAGRGTRRTFVGAGMVPRGEVGLIFAAAGRASGVLPPGIFVSVVLAVFATTFLAPPLLKALRPRPPAEG